MLFETNFSREFCHFSAISPLFKDTFFNKRYIYVGLQKYSWAFSCVLFCLFLHLLLFAGEICGLQPCGHSHFGVDSGLFQLSQEQAFSAILLQRQPAFLCLRIVSNKRRMSYAQYLNRTVLSYHSPFRSHKTNEYDKSFIIRKVVKRKLLLIRLP